MMSKPTLLVLDCASETNVGDTALQAALIELLRKHYPGHRIAATAFLGANQMSTHGGHFEELRASVDAPVGGSLRPTFFPTGDTKGNPYVLELLNIVGLLLGFVIIALLWATRGVIARWLPRQFTATWRMIEQADFVVWKGKNFRGRSNRLIENYRIASRLFMAVACLVCRKPVACVGASVWPLKSGLSGWMLRQVVDRCVHVSVRESASLRQVRMMLRHGAQLSSLQQVPDLSFALLRRHHSKSPTELPDRPRKVALTLVDWSEFGQVARNNYVDAVATFSKYLIEQHDAELTIVPQVVKSWESNERVVGALLDAVGREPREGITVHDGAPGVEELLQTYRGNDLLVATRMHSAVFSLGIGTPVLAIPYDMGPKWSILEDLGYGEFLIPYDRVSATDLRSMFQSLWARRVAVMKEVQNSLSEAYERVDENVLLFSSWIGGNTAR